MSDDRLRTYRAKRDFDVTSEPSGTAPPIAAGGNRFVVQRHRASRLHYDLRLEAAGVLLSWAVPKGPTLDPDVRRMAVHVEDHPLDYFDFEGVIPAGEYGGGDVIVWDWGTWDLAGDATDALSAVDDGDVHFDLHGEKLDGRFVLVRRGRDRDREWLLLKKRDDSSRSGWDPEDHPRSVKSGRTNDEVEAAPSASWSGTGIWAAPSGEELAALDDIDGSGDWSIGEHVVRLTGLDDVLFPAHREHPPVTRRDLVRHFANLAPVILPYMADRPATVHRFPHGIDEPGSWQRKAPGRTPAWIRRWPLEDDPNAATTHLVVESPAALAWLANRAALELVVWSSTVQHPKHPTWAVMVIQPSDEGTSEDVLVVARLCRTALEHLDVRAQPVLDGVGGLRIWIPVGDRTSLEQAGGWINSLGSAIGGTVPELVGARVQLGRAGSGVDDPLLVPFSVRPAPGAPIATPVSWDELDDDDLDLTTGRWRIGDVAERVAERGDPLAPLIGRQQRLAPL